MELLCPAGNPAGLRAAVDFGADAVYLAGEEFGMRASAVFQRDQLRAAVDYAHARNVRVHVACNTLPHPEEMARMPQYLAFLETLGVDAAIVSDLGVMRLFRRYAPSLELHVSVQAGVVNSETARAFYELGASRVVLARELTLREIAAIRADTPPELMLEAFAHGAMCMSMSARCLLSDYLTGRDANRGACAQPCRWRYALAEEKRPGRFFEIGEDAAGAYILNADDLNMSAHLDKMRDAGIGSIKIEGRAKSEYYIAVTTNAYRGALDSLRGAGPGWQPPAWVAEELEKVSHRRYSTGFYFGRPQGAQSYENGGYIRGYAVAATVDGYAEGCILATLKNKFLRGQILDCLEAGSAPFAVPTDRLYNDAGEAIAEASHPMMKLKIPFGRPVKPGSVLRMRLTDNAASGCGEE